MRKRYEEILAEDDSPRAPPMSIPILALPSFWSPPFFEAPGSAVATAEGLQVFDDDPAR